MLPLLKTEEGTLILLHQLILLELAVAEWVTTTTGQGTLTPGQEVEVEVAEEITETGIATTEIETEIATTEIETTEIATTETAGTTEITETETETEITETGITGTTGTTGTEETETMTETAETETVEMPGIATETAAIVKDLERALGTILHALKTNEFRPQDGEKAVI